MRGLLIFVSSLPIPLKTLDKLKKNCNNNYHNNQKGLVFSIITYQERQSLIYGIIHIKKCKNFIKHTFSFNMN
jgi:hypothetical protein